MNAYNGIADTNELSYLGGFRSNSIYYKNEAVTHEGKLYFSVKDENVSVPCEGNWTWPELTIVEGAANAPKTASITLVPSNENSMTPAKTLAVFSKIMQNPADKSLFRQPAGFSKVSCKFCDRRQVFLVADRPAIRQRRFGQINILIHICTQRQATVCHSFLSYVETIYSGVPI